MLTKYLINLNCRAFPSAEDEGALPEILSGPGGPKRGFGNSFQPAIDAPRYNLTSCVIAPSAKMGLPVASPRHLIPISTSPSSLAQRCGTKGTRKNQLCTSRSSHGPLVYKAISPSCTNRPAVDKS